MRVAGFAGALVLLVLAGAAAMLAADVRSWERTMRSDNRAHASQAETLLGILTFGDLAPAGADQLLQGPAPPTPDQAEAAIGDFQRASRDDPENTPAKFNLELLLRILTAQGVRIGGNNQAGIGATGKRGAGGGGPGSGY